MAVIDRAAAHQGWPLRGVPLYIPNVHKVLQCIYVHGKQSM